MGFPMTPVFQTVQTTGTNTDNGVAIKDYVQEVIRLLDEFTLNPEEARILEIVSALSPEQFYVFINSLARSEYEEYNRNPHAETSRSYLQKLYEDLNGEEFTAFNALMKSKLLAYKIGNIKNFSETIQAILLGNRQGGVVAAYKTYEPPGITSPSSWADGSFFAYGSFNVDGILRITWLKRRGLFTGSDHIRETLIFKPTDLAVLTHLEIPGKVEFTTVLELLNLSDKAHRNEIFDTLNIIGIVFGASAFSAVKGVAKKAVVGLFQVAIPSAGQYVTEHEAEIMMMSHGREFLIAFQVFNMGMAAYGLIRMLGAGGKLILDRLKQSSKQLAEKNPTDDIAQSVSVEISKVDDAIDEVKTKVVDQGSGNTSPDGPGPGPPRSRVRQEIDPNYPPPLPAHIPDNGQAIATGLKEEEIFFELTQLSPQRRQNVEIYRHDADQSFLLVEYPAGSSLEHVTRPTGYTRTSKLLYKILNIYIDKLSAKKRFFDEILAEHGRGGMKEYGLYEKVYTDGTVRYSVIVGHDTAFSVTAPDGWTCISHSHPEAHLKPGFRFPSPQDYDPLKFEWFKQGGNARIESSIHSIDSSGRLVEIKYGVGGGMYFVETPSGNIKWFRFLYDEDAIVAASSPLTIGAKRDELRVALGAGILTEAAHNLEIWKVLSQVDPALNYGSWWAQNFLLSSSP